MEAKRRARRAERKRKSTGAARVGAKATRGSHNGSFEQAIQKAVSGSGTVSVGLVNLVKNTLVTAISGARDVGGEMGTAAVAAGRGPRPAAGGKRAPPRAPPRKPLNGTH